MNTPLVSIVIPVYNVERYLRRCLDSVMMQTYTNIEIICINDGSPDGSGIILREYAAKDKRIKLIEIENQGLSGARNIGIANSEGDYMMFLDSDDWIDNNTVEEAMSGFLEHNTDIVLWNYVKEYSNTSQPVDVFFEELFFDKSSFRVLHQQLIGLTGEQLRNPAHCDSISTAWGKLYRSDLITNNCIRFVNTRIIGTEDLLFNAEYFNYCQTALALPGRYNHYRKQNSESLARQYKPLLYQQWTELQKRLKDICSNKEYLIVSVSNRTALSLIGLGINEAIAPYSIITKYKHIRDILHDNRFKDALNKIDISYMPLHWKFFFFSARNCLTISTIGLIYAITALTSRY